MTQDEIIEMAKKAGFLEHKDQFYTNHEYGDCKLELVAFAKLVAAKEREACAKVCEEHLDGLSMIGGAFVTCASAIRARGEA
jgi:hypothetical protein